MKIFSGQFFFSQLKKNTGREWRTHPGHFFQPYGAIKEMTGCFERIIFNKKRGEGGSTFLKYRETKTLKEPKQTCVYSKTLVSIASPPNPPAPSRFYASEAD